MQKQALTDLVVFAGGRVHLARMLTKPLSTVNSWIDRGKVSREGALEISKHPTFSKEFTISRMRPDL
jgi:hypothetical protein